MTSITLPNVWGSGLANYGRQTPEEMIRQIRAYAKFQADIMTQILTAADEDFQIETYVGVHVKNKCEYLQKSRFTT